MSVIPESIQNLIDEFAKLPGIGPKTAQRLTFYLLRKPDRSSQELGRAAQGLKEGIKYCEVCKNFTDQDICSVCGDSARDGQTICVVCEPLDVVAIEKTHSFRGKYHVLGGVISPVDGIGPDELFIAELVGRVRSGDIQELILATNPTLEGETTSLYLQKALVGTPVKLTKLAHGLPVGGDLEYADEITLQRALEGRREF